MKDVLYIPLMPATFCDLQLVHHTDTEQGALRYAAVIV